MVYSEAILTGELPSTFNQAVISVILQKGKDPLDPTSYRPISLAGVAYKIVTKVLVMCPCSVYIQWSPFGPYI